MQSAECRMQSAECRVQNAERRMQGSGEQGAKVIDVDAEDTGNPGVGAPESRDST